MERDKTAFPGGAVGAVLDVNEQQVDLRTKNSWTMKLADVSTGELAEASPEPLRFIVNVSAMEVNVNPEP
ncbi:hypothetical protein T484DRAFT_1802716 [Baffinella frigidus]|nr:hypothetical protein T484DRAFT_1802716 [Cryptophyta sp. CCMP2293]